MYGTLANSLEYVLSHLAAALMMAGFGDLFGLELLLMLAVWWAARSCSHFGEAFFARVEVAGSRFAKRTVAAPCALAASVILVRLALLPIHPMPQPSVADEFSHLLLADTLAHGRLANPSHPVWPSLEALHVIQTPTYSSMYFPGPAMLLLLGQVVTGEPWLGLLGATGALCGLVCWALQAWFPPRWALLGGVLTALHIGIASYWMDSYWGGTFPAIGSTLLLGALARLQKRITLGWQSTGLALLVAVGIAMLANSRPYEGLMFCLPVGVRLAWWLFGGLHLGQKLMHCVVPMALLLALTGAAMGIYFHAVTGSATQLPYAINQEKYGWPMTLPWTDVKLVKHDRPEFADYYSYEMSERAYFGSLTEYVSGLFLKLQMDWRFYAGPALMIPCLFFLRIYRKVRLRFLMLAGAVVVLAVYLEPHFPHYLAPALVPLVAVWVEGYRHLRQGTGASQRLGLRLSRAIPLVLLATVSLRLAATPLGLVLQPSAGYTSWCCSNPGSVNQDSIERGLPPGRHLLMVRYRHNHFWMNDWVHNRADIDEGRVVWARELGGAADAKLLAYFKDRQIWLWEPDPIPRRLTRYPLSKNLLTNNYKREK